jgi:hypothetical protein
MLTPRTTGGYSPVYVLSTIFFIMALGGIVVLLGTDILHHMSFSTLHQHLDAWPLCMIGLSYITLNLEGSRSRADRIKGIFLGVAFLLWGGEQLIPPSRVSTVMDEGAVSIFVIDVSFIIWDRIRV